MSPKHAEAFSVKQKQLTPPGQVVSGLLDYAGTQNEHVGLPGDLNWLEARFLGNVVFFIDR